MCRLLVLGDQLVGDGHENLVELRPHRVLELQPAGALLELHLLVVGQVDGDGLGAGVGLAGVVHDVVGVEVGVAARPLPLVGRGHRQTSLKLREQGDVARQPAAPFLVLDQDVCLVRGLVAEEFVLVRLDRTDDDIDGVSLHVHPGQIAGPIVVGLQRAGTQLEVVPEPGILGELRRLAELGGGAAGGSGEGLVVGHRAQATRAVAPDHGVQASQRLAGLGRCRGGPLELLLRHVVRIELGAGRTRAHARHEGLVAVEPVPGAVVQENELSGGGVGDRAEERVAGGVGLLPEDGVHLLRGVDEERDHPPLPLAEAAEVGGKADRRVLRELGRDGRRDRCPRLSATFASRHPTALSPKPVSAAQRNHGLMNYRPSSSRSPGMCRPARPSPGCVFASR